MLGTVGTTIPPRPDRFAHHSSGEGPAEHLTIGLCGDLKFGRTVHSLLLAMSRYAGIKFVLISPEELRVPEYLRNEAF